ncbi:hypothetical protein [Flavobacterium silvaticum]|uniref:3-hydroxymyristoyl/3-hydroxydecanoyl-(Acyl carrier protein) dehydratase n=1 Tax=Flavobacterium silvaticum TaxID=1852020 RepID=A0A972JF84_9FLAO|nr:hypothetical protein [Flavobacterium silvaticum]NMH27689.1 hypothetical protein [Flavobacterium silvaticum]
MEFSGTTYDSEFVGNLIPQKTPFVMVDKLLSFTETSIEAGLDISAENIFANHGHFAEAGLVEHMAQTVALHTGYQFYLRKEQAPTGYIGSITSLEIHSLPPVYSTLISRAEILQEFAGITLVDVTTSCNGVEIAKGQLKTVLAK